MAGVKATEGAGVSDRGRIVRLRSGEGGRYLDAWRDADGRVHLEGQDLGLVTAVVSPRVEVEWFQTIAAENLPRLLELLDASQGADILDVLEEHWCGAAADELESRIRTSDIPVQRHVI